MSLKNEIITFLSRQYPRIIHSGEIERFAMDMGYKASNSGRRCRELEVDGKIEVFYNDKHEAQYRYRPKVAVQQVL